MNSLANHVPFSRDLFRRTNVLWLGIHSARILNVPPATDDAANLLAGFEVVNARLLPRHSARYVAEVALHAQKAVLDGRLFHMTDLRAESILRDRNTLNECVPLTPEQFRQRLDQSPECRPYLPTSITSPQADILRGLAFGRTLEQIAENTGWLDPTMALAPSEVHEMGSFLTDCSKLQQLVATAGANQSRVMVRRWIVPTKLLAAETTAAQQALQGAREALASQSPIIPGDWSTLPELSRHCLLVALLAGRLAAISVAFSHALESP